MRKMQGCKKHGNFTQIFFASFVWPTILHIWNICAGSKKYQRAKSGCFCISVWYEEVLTHFARQGGINDPE